MNAQIVNYNCDGQGFGNCTGEHSQVRSLPLGGGANVIVCHSHYNNEINFRKIRNNYLDNSAKFDLPSWESLEVYTGA